MPLPTSLSFFLLSIPVAAVIFAGGTSAETGGSVRIAYQTTVDPAKVAQADGRYEKATGQAIDWRRFESGNDVINAVASGAAEIGYVGSSPLAAAVSRELPIETIFVAAQLGSAEALVVRNGSGITQPSDLIGKKIAAPLGSTTHYSLLAALKHWHIDARRVTVMILRPSEIVTAYAKGDIDGAYVWNPALGQLKQNGSVLATSADVAAWGAPSFDAWVVRKDFAARHPEFVAAFVKTTGEAYAAYRDDPKAFVADAANIEKIARLSGASAQDVADGLAGASFPTLAEQASPALLGGGTAQAIADTAAFLKSQGQLDKLLKSYTAAVNPRFVAEATATANAEPPKHVAQLAAAR